LIPRRDRGCKDIDFFYTSKKISIN
jgi:hypothetical protein